MLFEVFKTNHFRILSTDLGKDCLYQGGMENCAPLPRGQAGHHLCSFLELPKGFSGSLRASFLKLLNFLGPVLLEMGI